MTDFDGINTLSAYLERCIKAAEPAAILDAQQAAADHMASVMNALSKPRKTGKMLSSFSSRQNTAAVETEFGWGRFYGRLKESGHRTRPTGKRSKKAGSRGVRFLAAQPHLKPAFQSNKEIITKLMVETLERRK